MQKITLLPFLALSLAVAGPAVAEVLPAGTTLSVRLAQSIDTQRDHAGTRFLAHTSNAVVRGGRVVIPRGAVCHGHVVESKPSGRLKGRAVVALSLDSVEVNGRTYNISTSHTTRVSNNHKKRNAVLIGGGAGTGAAIGAVAGGGVGALVGAGAGAAAGTTGAAITGKRNVHLPAETRLSFVLRQPVSLTR